MRKVLLASDAGYGFVTETDHMATKNTKGKAMLSLPANARPLVPEIVEHPETDYLAAVTTEGRMLLFPVRDLPELPRGKGNKIVQIPPKAAREGRDLVKFIQVLPEGAAVKLHSGKQAVRFTWGNLSTFMGERGRRGKRLPRGYQRVDRIEVIPPAPPASESPESVDVEGGDPRE